MMRQRRWGDVELHLKLADAQTVVSRTNQRTEDFEPGRIAQSFEASGCVIEFHEHPVTRFEPRVNDISRMFEIPMSSVASWAQAFQRKDDNLVGDTSPVAAAVNEFGSNGVINQQAASTAAEPSRHAGMPPA